MQKYNAEFSHKPGVCQKDLQKQSLRTGKASVYQGKVLQCCCCVLLAREEARRGDRLESAHLNWVLKHRGLKGSKLEVNPPGDLLCWSSFMEATFTQF